MQTIGLSNIQRELLKLYANNISDETLLEIKQILADYFAAKASDEMDKFWDENDLSEQTMIDWANEHNRTKTCN